MVDDVGAGSAGVLAVDAVGGGDDDEELDVTLVEVVGEQLASLGRFGGGVLEAAGRQALGDGDAEDAEGDGQPGDSVQHGVSSGHGGVLIAPGSRCGQFRGSQGVGSEVTPIGMPVLLAERIESRCQASTLTSRSASTFW